MKPKKSLPDDISAPSCLDLQLKAIRRALAENVSAAMNVLGVADDDGTPGKLTQVDVHILTGIARSTVSRIVTDSKETPPNPDLVTLIKLAGLLNVPPFFLLMRPQDWEHLALASESFMEIMDNEALAEEVNRKTHVDKVRAGLEVAQKLGIYRPQSHQVDSSDREDEIRDDLEKQRRRTERAILAATAISQLSSREKSRLMLTTVGAIVGANQN